MIGTVIVHYGDPEVTRRCIDSIRSQCDKIIVVDNHGNFTTYKDVEVIMTENNEGYGPGCNIGARVLAWHGCDKFLFLNNDLTIEQPNFFKLLESAFEESKADIVSACIKTPEGRYSYTGAAIDVTGGTFDTKPSGFKYVETEIITGNCFAITADAFERVKFREDFFMYCEDLDFSIRAKAAGLKSVCAQYLYAVHKDHLHQASQLARYYHTRNLPYVMVEYSGRWWLLYYFLYFIPVRVVYFAIKFKFISALAVVFGACAYLKGEKCR
jgi:GT2 family glycosyltransferase